MSHLKTITLTAFNRPTYTQEVLQSLRCNNTTGYVLFIAVEPGCDRTIEICRAVDFMPVEVIVNPSRLGINHNNKNIYETVFNCGRQWNLAIEDDTPLSPDALELAEWFRTLPRSADYLLLNLFSENGNIARPLELFEFDAFCPWGYYFETDAYE